MNVITPSPRTKPKSQQGWVIFLYSKGRAESWLRSGSHSCSDSARSLQGSSVHDSPAQRSLQHNQGSTKLQHKLSVSAITPLLSGLAALPDRQPVSQPWNAEPARAAAAQTSRKEGKGSQAAHCMRPALQLGCTSLVWKLQEHTPEPRAAGWHCCPHVSLPISDQS